MKIISLIAIATSLAAAAPASAQTTSSMNPYTDTVITTSGLRYHISSPQTESPQFAQAGDKVTVHYTGTLTDGKKFDSSKDRNQPFTFTIGRGQVIKGWDEGIALIPKGSKGILIIPAELGYGAQQMGSIPANSTLIFEVEVLDIQGSVAAFDGKGKDTITLKSGLRMVKIQTGNGRKPKAGDQVKVHYTGRLASGKVFDSSHDRGEPIPFTLGQGQVIKGWDEGIAQMGVGDKYILIIPPDLGYGSQGAGQVIPPNATLVFDVELVDAKEMVQPKPYNTKGKDTVTTASGLKYLVVSKGKGPQAKTGQTAEVHYSGYLLNGKLFDSSVQRGEPFSFTIGKGQVIKGWDEGVGLMHVGDKIRMIIPANLGYGSRNMGVIPPNSTLVFDVELLGVK